MMNPAMAAQYRQQQALQQRVPQPSQARRAQGPPAMTTEQIRIQRERQQMQNEQLKRQEQDRERIKALKPSDRTMPDGVEEFILGDGVQQYKKLREVERKLDSIMMRKYLDMRDSAEGKARFAPPQSSRKKLKIWISNTVENQPWQGGSMEESAFDFNMGVEATYRVKIEGQLIKEDEDEQMSDVEESPEDEDAKKPQSGEDNTPAKGQKPAEEKEADKRPPTAPGQPQLRPRERTKLSHFLKSIAVNFERDKHLQPENMTQVEWKKPFSNSGVLQPAADFDSLEFERKSDENINCTINFYWDEPPDRERYLLSQPLQQLLDTEVDDRTSIIKGIWDYIRAKGLQQDDNKRAIQCDDRMKAVFERDVIFFPHIPAMIQPHLNPLPPVTVPYTIRVDPDYHSLPNSERYTTYILTIPVATSPPPPMDIPALQDLSKKDDQVAELIQAIGNSQRKHSFFAQLSRDPVTFLKRWMASQKRDLEVILGEDGNFQDPSNLGGEWAKGGKDGVWGKDSVKEAVNVMVQKPDKTARAF